jgi:hypothetical protein
MYAFLSAWVLILGGTVAFTMFNDPSNGHAGRWVFPDEPDLESFERHEPVEIVPGARPFRLEKSDRVEKMNGLATHMPFRAWILVKSGPHAGRSGVMDW